MVHFLGRKIVIKIGSSVLANERGLDAKRFGSMASQIAGLRNSGHGVLVVTSGAVAVGKAMLAGLEYPATRRACAAAGQSALMRHYGEIFGRHGQEVAQILLTQEDLLEERRKANLLSTLDALLGSGIIPIINENDAVSVRKQDNADWLNFGDNDTLAAAIACGLKVDLLVLLTNVDGVFDRYPLDGNSKLIRRVRCGDATIERLANGASKSGRGGMLSKIRAASKAAENGVTVAIANGNREGILEEVVKGVALCTYFEP